MSWNNLGIAYQQSSGNFSNHAAKMQDAINSSRAQDSGSCSAFEPVHINLRSHSNVNEIGLNTFNAAQEELCQNRQDQLNNVYSEQKKTLENIYGTGLAAGTEILIDGALGLTPLNPIAAYGAGHGINQAIPPVFYIRDQKMLHSMPNIPDLGCNRTIKFFDK